MEASNVTLQILYQRLKIGILHVCEVPGSGVLNTMSIKLPMQTKCSFQLK